MYFINKCKRWNFLRTLNSYTLFFKFFVIFEWLLLWPFSYIFCVHSLLCCFVYLYMYVSSPVLTSYIGGLLIVLRLALSPSLLFSLSWTWYCCLFLHLRWYTFVLIVMWEVNKSPMTCILPYWYIIFVCYATSSPITLRPFHIKT